MATGYLPVNQNWERYKHQSKVVYEDMERETKQLLMRLANDACEKVNDGRYSLFSSFFFHLILGMSANWNKATLYDKGHNSVISISRVMSPFHMEDETYILKIHKYIHLTEKE